MQGAALIGASSPLHSAFPKDPDAEYLHLEQRMLEKLGLQPKEAPPGSPENPGGDDSAPNSQTASLSGEPWLPTPTSPARGTAPIARAAEAIHSQQQVRRSAIVDDDDDDSDDSDEPGGLITSNAQSQYRPSVKANASALAAAAATNDDDDDDAFDLPVDISNLGDIVAASHHTSPQNSSSSASRQSQPEASSRPNVHEATPHSRKRKKFSS